MPRRAPKHAIKPGQVLNPNGRPVGAANKIVISEKVREAFAQLLENNIGELEGWLHALAKKSPEKALDIWVRISERFVPSLQRTDVHLEGPGLMIPIQINLPNPPQINIGESTPTSLLASPAEEVKELGEGTSTGLSQIPVFLPEREVIQEFSEGAPTEDRAEDSREFPLDKL